MPDWICLKAWMAVCWKVSWKVDPLALSVPLRPLDPEPPPLVLDELQAVSDKAIAARAAPAITTPWLRTRCIVNIPSQLPADCCEEDGLDAVRAVLAWPKIMLTAGAKAAPIARGPMARPVCPVISRPAVALGSWNAGQAAQGLDLGIVTSVPRSRSIRCPLRPWSAAAPMLLPHTGNASTFSRALYRVLPAQTVIVHNQ